MAFAFAHPSFDLPLAFLLILGLVFLLILLERRGIRGTRKINGAELLYSQATALRGFEFL